MRTSTVLQFLLVNALLPLLLSTELESFGQVHDSRDSACLNADGGKIVQGQQWQDECLVQQEPTELESSVQAELDDSGLPATRNEGSVAVVDHTSVVLRSSGEDDGLDIADTTTICIDEHSKCEEWASFDECEKNPNYMLRHCRKSCNQCDPQTQEPELGRSITSSSCQDAHEKCEEWAAMDECAKNPNYMLKNCRYSCALCQNETKIEPTAENRHAINVIRTCYGDAQHVTSRLVRERVKEVHDYMIHRVFQDEVFSKIRAECKNRHPRCTVWASWGECEKNAGYMRTNCAAACFSCDYLDFDMRCAWDRSVPPIWRAGDLNRMFERIVNDPSYQELYQPTILSRPRTDHGEDLGGPWIITLQNFLSAEECDRLVELAGERGYERSMDVGEIKYDGTYESLANPNRTSTNAWCYDSCEEDPVVHKVTQRIEQLLNIPQNHFEHFQMLRYEVGQKYGTHHDCIAHQVDRPVGVRILTVFLYLNDVAAGGGTQFPLLNLTVTPQKGKALVWPSVLNQEPDEIDPRTDHQALPVEEGIKYGANSWIHSRDFKTYHKNDCS